MLSVSRNMPGNRRAAGCSAGGCKSEWAGRMLLKRAAQGVQRAKPGLAKPSANPRPLFSEVRLRHRLVGRGAVFELPRCSCRSYTRWDTRDRALRDPAAMSGSGRLQISEFSRSRV